jgi:hypothetical protein
MKFGCFSKVLKLLSDLKRHILQMEISSKLGKIKGCS